MKSKSVLLVISVVVVVVYYKCYTKNISVPTGKVCISSEQGKLVSLVENGFGTLLN